MHRRRYYARKTAVGRVSKSEYMPFLAEHHLWGATGAKFAYSLFAKDGGAGPRELVAVASFLSGADDIQDELPLPIFRAPALLHGQEGNGGGRSREAVINVRQAQLIGISISSPLNSQAEPAATRPVSLSPSLEKMPLVVRSAALLALSWPCHQCSHSNDSSRNKKRCSSCRAWRDGLAPLSAKGSGTLT